MKFEMGDDFNRENIIWNHDRRPSIQAVYEEWKKHFINSEGTVYKRDHEGVFVRFRISAPHGGNTSYFYDYQVRIVPSYIKRWEKLLSCRS